MNSSWDDYSFVIRSQRRLEILKELKKKPKMPQTLVTLLNLKASSVSRTLKELGARGLVQCLTPRAKKGRIYSISDKGERILESIGN